MPNVSEQLRQGREAKGWSVHQIAEITKIKTEHVRALENGDFDVFSAPIYIRGFVRSYAMAVSLDVEAVMEDLGFELSRTDNLSAPPALTGPKRGILDHLMYFFSQTNWRVVAPVAALLIVIGAMVYGYRAMKQREAFDPGAELGPGLYQGDGKPVGETMPIPAVPPSTNDNR